MKNLPTDLVIAYTPFIVAVGFGVVVWAGEGGGGVGVGWIGVHFDQCQKICMLFITFWGLARGLLIKLASFSQSSRLLKHTMPFSK